MKESRTTKLLILIVLGALALKASLLALHAIPFDADEAVVALMARHILQGKHMWFFYGQAYMGSLDAYLVAAAFSIMGQSVLAMRLVQVALFTGTLLGSYLAARRVTGSRHAALVAVLLLAFPPVLLTVYTTATLGGYGEILLLGSVLIWLGHRLGCEDRKRRWLWVAWGVLTGIGFWSMALILVYATPVLLWLLWRALGDAGRGRGQAVLDLAVQLALVCLGFALGSVPWWLGGGLRGIRTLVGQQAIRAPTGRALLDDVPGRLFNFVALGLPALFGLRFPWSLDGPPLWLGIPTVALYLGALGFALYRWRETARYGHALLWGIPGLLFLGFMLTPRGQDPSGRYLLPLFLPLTIFTAEAVLALSERIGRWAWLLLSAVLAFNLFGTTQAVLNSPPGTSTRFSRPSETRHRNYDELIDFLHTQGEARGYTTYWIAYPVAFLSEEQIVLVPRLPYNASLGYTPRDNRYAPYGEIVEDSPTAVYVTNHHPKLDQLLRERFTDLGVAFREKQISSYRVFYSLSRKVTPEELSIRPRE